MTKILRSTFLALLLMIVFAAPALAHKVNVFAFAEAGQVKVESYFADGRPVKQSRVLVFDSHDELLLEGKTDDDGLCSFPIPKVDTLKIVVHEILGHRASFELKKEEVEAAMARLKEKN